MNYFIETPGEERRRKSIYMFFSSFYQRISMFLYLINIITIWKISNNNLSYQKKSKGRNVTNLIKNKREKKRRYYHMNSAPVAKQYLKNTEWAYLDEWCAHSVSTLHFCLMFVNKIYIFSNMEVIFWLKLGILNVCWKWWSYW